MPVLIDYAAIKAALTMQTVLDHYGIQEGRNHKALCPFHSDHDASLHVYEDGFFCFVCRAGGDVIKFIAMMEHCSNRAAAVIAGALAGISFDEIDTYGAKESARKRAMAQHKQEKLIKELRSRYDAACKRLHIITLVLTRTPPDTELWYRALANRTAAVAEVEEIYGLFSS